MNGGGAKEASMEVAEGKCGVVRDGETVAAAVSLEALRKRMADFATERDWEQFHSPRNLLLALITILAYKPFNSPVGNVKQKESEVGEVGELSEIFQWKGEVPKGLPGWAAAEKEHLGEELADVLLYLVRLSDMCGVDLGKAALRKMEINARKYPVGQCKGSSKKHTHYGSTNSVSANDNVNAVNIEHHNGV